MMKYKEVLTKKSLKKLHPTQMS